MVRRISKSSASGFTIIEVMFTIFMMAGIAMIVTAVFPSGQISRTKATYSTYAVNLAQQKVEEIKSAGYSGVLVTPTVNAPLNLLPNGNLSTTITEISSHVKKIQVTVTWDGYRKVGGDVSLVTFISDHS